MEEKTKRKCLKKTKWKIRVNTLKLMYWIQLKAILYTWLGISFLACRKIRCSKYKVQTSIEEVLNFAEKIENKTWLGASDRKIHTHLINKNNLILKGGQAQCNIYWVPPHVGSETQHFMKPKFGPWLDHLLVVWFLWATGDYASWFPIHKMMMYCV